MSRTLISIPTTWYVDNVNGSDANDGSTPALAFKTIQHGLDTLTAQHDFAGTPTLQLLANQPAGTPTVYRERVNLNRWVGSAMVFRVIGDVTNNAAVIVAPQNDHSIISSHTNGCPWQLESFMIQSSPGYYGLISDWGADVCVLDMNFGGCGIAHMFAEFGGKIEVLWDARTNGNYVISGGAGQHMQASCMGLITLGLNSIIFQNNPTINCFASGGFGGFVSLMNLKGYSGARSIPMKVDPSAPNVAGPQGGVAFP